MVIKKTVNLRGEKTRAGNGKSYLILENISSLNEM